MRVVDYATATHAGRVRRKNEDAYFAEPPLFAVADGMGGALAGELASRISVQTLAELAPGGQRRGAPGRDHPPRQPARGRARDLRSPRVGHGLDRHRGARRARRRHVRARRRLARLSVARRRPHAPLERPLAGRRMGARRRAGTRGGGAAPAALGHHARTRRRLADRHRRLDDAGAHRRRHPALHGRSQRVRRRCGGRAHARAARAAGRRRALPDRRGQCRGRGGQHHGRRAPPRGGGGRSRGRRRHRRGLRRAPDRDARGRRAPARRRAGAGTCARARPGAGARGHGGRPRRASSARGAGDPARPQRLRSASYRRRCPPTARP